ncbi:hypothetical protein BURKHO8Y_10193 [Burkholderia sp. 8Y]|nr:hypothetical protein BURKHO8Y_10193 [Burkholderia sp. 8Y]
MATHVAQGLARRRTLLESLVATGPAAAPRMVGAVPVPLGQRRRSRSVSPDYRMVLARHTGPVRRVRRALSRVVHGGMAVLGQRRPAYVGVCRARADRRGARLVSDRVRADSYGAAGVRLKGLEAKPTTQTSRACSTNSSRPCS